MRTLGWILLFVFGASVFVAGGQAIFKWWEVSEAVEGAVLDARGAGSNWAGEGATKARSGILRRLAAAGVTLTEDRVSVNEEGGSLRVRLRWLHPVLTMQDDMVIAIPMSIDRTYTPRR